MRTILVANTNISIFCKVIVPLVSLECMTHTIINFKCKRNVLFKQGLISNMCVRRAHDYFHSKAKKLKKKGHGQKETRSN